MKTPIQYADFIEVYDLACELAFALADQTLHAENVGSGIDALNEYSLELLGRARGRLDLAEYRANRFRKENK